MTRCEGTTAKQALANRKLRDTIVDDPSVKKLFHVYEFSEGTVTLDHNHAYQHVRNCINSMKKARTYMPSHVKVEAHHDEEVCIVTKALWGERERSISPCVGLRQHTLSSSSGSSSLVSVSFVGGLEKWQALDLSLALLFQCDWSPTWGYTAMLKPLQLQSSLCIPTKLAAAAGHSGHV